MNRRWGRKELSWLWKVRDAFVWSWKLVVSWASISTVRGVLQGFVEAFTTVTVRWYTHRPLAVVVILTLYQSTHSGIMFILEVSMFVSVRTGHCLHLDDEDSEEVREGSTTPRESGTSGNDAKLVSRLSVPLQVIWPSSAFHKVILLSCKL